MCCAVSMLFLSSDVSCQQVRFDLIRFDLIRSDPILFPTLSGNKAQGLLSARIRWNKARCCCPPRSGHRLSREMFRSKGPRPFSASREWWSAVLLVTQEKLLLSFLALHYCALLNRWLGWHILSPYEFELTGLLNIKKFRFRCHKSWLSLRFDCKIVVIFAVVGTDSFGFLNITPASQVFYDGC